MSIFKKIITDITSYYPPRQYCTIKNWHSPVSNRGYIKALIEIGKMFPSKKKCSHLKNGVLVIREALQFEISKTQIKRLTKSKKSKDSYKIRIPLTTREIIDAVALKVNIEDEVFAKERGSLKNRHMNPDCLHSFIFIEEYIIVLEGTLLAKDNATRQALLHSIKRK